MSGGIAYFLTLLAARPPIPARPSRIRLSQRTGLALSPVFGTGLGVAVGAAVGAAVRAVVETGVGAGSLSLGVDGNSCFTNSPFHVHPAGTGDGVWGSYLFYAAFFRNRSMTMKFP